MTRLHQVVAIIAGLFTIAIGLSTVIGLPFSSLLVFSKHTVVRVSANSRFSIDAIKDNYKFNINAGDKFSYWSGIPLSMRGETKLADTEMVWILLVDQNGRFYLQHPPVRISAGEWTATNLRPLEGIRRIVFARADDKAHKFFVGKVEHNEWGKFHPLPSGAAEIAFVDLE